MTTFPRIQAPSLNSDVCIMYRRIAIFLFALEVLGAIVPVRRANAEINVVPVKFDVETLAKPPDVFSTDKFPAEGTRAFFYAGMPYRGKPTRVFACYGVPEGPPESKVPAMVVIHGGGGTAFDRWVRVWTARGYAAIAMDLCGCVPEGTYGNWKRHEQGGPPLLSRYGWDTSMPQTSAAISG